VANALASGAARPFSLHASEARLLALSCVATEQLGGVADAAAAISGPVDPSLVRAAAGGGRRGDVGVDLVLSHADAVAFWHTVTRDAAMADAALVKASRSGRLRPGPRGPGVSLNRSTLETAAAAPAPFVRDVATVLRGLGPTGPLKDVRVGHPCRELRLTLDVALPAARVALELVGSNRCVFDRDATAPAAGGASDWASAGAALDADAAALAVRGADATGAAVAPASAFAYAHGAFMADGAFLLPEWWAAARPRRDVELRVALARRAGWAVVVVHFAEWEAAGAVGSSYRAAWLRDLVLHAMRGRPVQASGQMGEGDGEGIAPA
jgi:hypothetical protein